MIPMTIRMPPAMPSGVMDSRRKIQPQIAAVSGFNPNRIPVVCALIFLCATGCSVKPRQVQISVSMSSIIHCVPVSGKCGVSKAKDTSSAVRPMKPTCKMPMLNASCFFVQRSLRMIAQAKAKAAIQQRNSPSPKLRIPPFKVIIAMPIHVMKQLRIILRDGALWVSSASSMGTIAMAEFSRKAQVEDEVY